MSLARTSAIASLAALAVVSFASAQAASGRMTVSDGTTERIVPITSAGVVVSHSCGGITPGPCDDRPRLHVHATLPGDPSAITLTVSAASIAPTSVLVGRGARRAWDEREGVCGDGTISIVAAAGTIEAQQGTIRLTRWTTTAAEGTFTATVRMPGGVQSWRGSFSVTHPEPPRPPPCTEPLP
jgi:hypothetical protein